MSELDWRRLPAIVTEMIHVLPGLGEDNSIYRDEWRALENCAFHNWPSYQGEESLTTIAQRIVDEARVSDGDVVAGHSLGGMVACEIAQLRKLSGLVLISSASRREEISGLLATLHPLAAFTPFEFIQALAGKLPGELTRMFCRSDPEFIRATCAAIFKWEGLKAGSIRPARIHGRHDLVIPLPDGVDCVVDGGHMLPITHAKKCVDFLKAILLDSQQSR